MSGYRRTNASPTSSESIFSSVEKSMTAERSGAWARTNLSIVTGWEKTHLKAASCWTGVSNSSAGGGR